VQSQNPLAFWEFEDASSNNGDTAASTVNSAAYNGTYYAGTGHQVTLGASAAGLGQAAFFHNTTGALTDMDRVVAANTGLPSGSADRTVTFWANTTASGLSEALGYGTEEANKNFAVFMNGTGKVQASQWGDSATGPTSGNDGHWHFYAVTTKNSAWTVYTDGVAGAPLAMTTDTSLANGVGMTIGTWFTGASGSFSGWNGGLDGVAVFNKALTASEVGYLYNGTVVPEPSALILALTGLTGLLAYAWRKHK
jgi:hypothetical protein